MSDTDSDKKKNGYGGLPQHQSSPYAVFNPDGSSPVLVVCDHASPVIPHEFQQLGLNDDHLDGHIAWDIGAAEVAMLVARHLDATSVMARQSRLVVDCNRHLQDPSAFAPISDGVVVPGNQNLSDQHREDRAERFFWPYHAQIARRLAAIQDLNQDPVLISIHSFTPILQEFARPWKIGVLWDEDPTVPVPLIDKLSERIGAEFVGDNQPYSGKDPEDFTVDYHVERMGIAHASIEIRQDLIDSDSGINKWATVLAEVLAEVLV